MIYKLKKKKKKEIKSYFNFKFNDFSKKEFRFQKYNTTQRNS